MIPLIIICVLFSAGIFVIFLDMLYNPTKDTVDYDEDDTVF